MANDVKIILSAVDKASSKIKGVAGSFTEFNSAISLIKQGFQAVGQIYGQTIGDTVAYGKQVREIATFTGMTTEETQRLIQVADDWGIEAGQVRVAMQMMAKNGIAPSIENLADLADEFVNTSDKAAFAEKASKLLGRQWTTLVPILKDGGQALRDQAAGISSTLVLTDDQLALTRRWEVALDNTGDAIKGITYAISTEFIPSMIEGADVITNWITLLSNAVIAENQLKAAEQAGVITTKEATDQINKMTWTSYSAADAQEWLTQQYQEHNYMMDEGKDKWREYRKQVELTTDAIDDNKLQISNLQLYLAGPMGDELDNFDKKQDELYTKLGEVSEQIAGLNTKKYLTKDQKQELEDLKKEQGEIQGEIDKTADAHDEATKRILIDLALQKVAMIENKDEQKKATDAVWALAQQWGLLDDPTMQAQKQMQTYLDIINNGIPPAAAMIAANLGGSFDDLKGRINAARLQADNLYTSIQKVANKRFKTYLDIIATMKMSPADIVKVTGQHGLNMKVPSGFPNDTFPVFASSGERVIIQTPGQQAQGKVVGGGSATGGGDIYMENYFNISGLTADQVSLLIEHKLSGRLGDAMRYAQAGGGIQGM